MKKYIFLTNDGYTYTENENIINPDIENAQMLGISEGNTVKEALNNLLKENTYIKEYGFRSIYCYKLTDKLERYEFDIQY